MLATILFIAFAIAYAILAWRDFRLALVLLFALLPTYLLRFSIGPVPSTMLEVFVVTLFVVWLLHQRVHPPNDLKQVIPPLIKGGTGGVGPLALLLVAAALAVLWSPDKLAALGIFKAYFVEPLLVFAMIRTTFTTITDWDDGLIAIGASVCVLSIFAIIQYVGGLGIPVPWDIEHRVTSVFEYPNALGLFVAPVVATLLVRNRFHLAIVLGAVAIILAKTEAALVAIPVAVVVGLFLKAGPRGQKMIPVIAFLGLILAFGFSPIREKLLLQDYSGQVRRAQWSEAVAFLKDHPLTGAGLTGYQTAIVPYHDATLYEIFQYPHNILLNIWMELGLLGVIASLWLAVVVTKHAWQYRHDPRVLVGFVALVAMAVHGLVDVPFFKNDLAILTVFFIAATLGNPALLVEKK